MQAIRTALKGNAFRRCSVNDVRILLIHLAVSKIFAIFANVNF